MQLKKLVDKLDYQMTYQLSDHFGNILTDPGLKSLQNDWFWDKYGKSEVLKISSSQQTYTDLLITIVI